MAVDYRYLIKETVTYTNYLGVSVTSEYSDALFYDAPQSDAQVAIDTAARVDSWVALQQLPPPPDPAPVFQLISDNGTLIDI